jgi:vancomycin resistance protein VanW
MKRLSELHPALYNLRVKQKQNERRRDDKRSRVCFASQIQSEPLPFCLTKHQSLLRRKLGDSDPQLQENKVVNLSIARQNIDGLLIRPGETFSFWRQVGEATAEKGYLEGIRLSRGEVKVGVGGGLCQLANLLLWMAWHSPLQVTERHHHSFDPFPDDRRALPFGSGASVFFNYVDLRFHNPTDAVLQLRVWLEAEHLKGSIGCDQQWPEAFHVIERNHAFVVQDGKNYRRNEIWRRVVDKTTGVDVREERLVENFAEVKYALQIESASDLNGASSSE